MSNKKRIRKLIRSKYKPTRKVIVFNEYVYGWDFFVAMEKAGREAEKATNRFLKHFKKKIREEKSSGLL